MKRLSLVSIAVLACATASAQEPAVARVEKDSPAAGKERWFLSLVPDAKAAKAGEKEFDDTLHFEKDKVELSTSKANGFAPSAYRLTRNGSVWSFTAEQSSSTAGTAIWSATFRGAAVEGKLTVKKGADTVINYTFTGRRETPLEGARFSIHVKPAASAGEEEEYDAERAVLVIERSKLSVQGDFGDHLAAVWIDLSDQGGKRTLTACQPGEDGTLREWTATVSGDTIKGTVLDKEDGEVVARHTFEGKRQARG